MDITLYHPSPQQPWNQPRLQHLTRRIGFGISYEDLPQLLRQKPNNIVKNYIRKAKRAEKLPEPNWSDWGKNRYKRLIGNRLNNKLIRKHAVEWMITLLEHWIENDSKGKMMIFWANHFVTGMRKYRSPSMMYHYFSCIEKYAFGNFKDFVKAIGLTPAMLSYLNGNRNRKSAPNENYARELLELFTLGRDNNYTQKDIQEIARAFSGYKIHNWVEVELIPRRHDKGLKTIFGQTGNWTYEDVIDILFEERAEEIALHICSELYRSFIHPEINIAFTKKLAQTFISNDFEITPVLEQLFQSKHFFSDEFIGTKIKSPLELTLTFIKELNIDIHSRRQFLQLAEANHWLGQHIFNPPDVSGYKGQRAWINTTQLTRRWEVLDGILYDGIGDNDMRTLVEDFMPHLTKNIQSPEVITQKVVDYFLPKGLQNQSDYKKAVMRFKREWEEAYGEEGWWNLERSDTEWQVAQLISYLFRLPEFHLS